MRYPQFFLSSLEIDVKRNSTRETSKVHVTPALPRRKATCRVLVRTTGVILALLSLPSAALASDMVLAVPIAWIPVLVITTLVSLILLAVYSRGSVPRWVRIITHVLFGVIAVPSIMLAVLTLPYLDGPYIDIAWTYMAAFVSASIGAAFMVRASVRAGRRERDASNTRPPTRGS